MIAKTWKLRADTRTCGTGLHMGITDNHHRHKINCNQKQTRRPAAVTTTNYLCAEQFHNLQKSKQKCEILNVKKQSEKNVHDTKHR